MSTANSASTAGDDGEVVLVPHREVRLVPVLWAWADRIAYGTATMLEGDTGAGKTVVAVDLAVRWAGGFRMPDGTDWDGVGEGVPVVYCGLDDVVSMVIAPRVEAAGGDATGRLFYWPDASPLMMPAHRDRVAGAIRRVGARVVVVDTFVRATDPEYEIGDYQRATAVMSAWDSVARETGVAIVLVNHKTKAAAVDSLSGGYGSKGGVNGVARSVLIVRRDYGAADGERVYVLEVAKSNYGRIAPPLAYRVTGAVAMGKGVDDEAVEVTSRRVDWALGHVVHRPGDAKAAADEARRRREVAIVKRVVGTGFVGTAADLEAALVEAGVPEARANGVRTRNVSSVREAGARNARSWVLRASSATADEVQVSDDFDLPAMDYVGASNGAAHGAW